VIRPKKNITIKKSEGFLNLLGNKRRRNINTTHDSIILIGENEKVNPTYSYNGETK